LFFNHRGHGEHRVIMFFISIFQLSVSSVSSVVLIGLPRGNNRARVASIIEFDLVDERE